MTEPHSLLDVILAEIAETVRDYHREIQKQSRLARERQQLLESKRMLAEKVPDRVVELEAKLDTLLKETNAKVPKPNPEYAKKGP